MLSIVAALVVFIFLTFLEFGLRVNEQRPIPVELEDNLPAKVAASVIPDFLWKGEAWTIRVESEVDVVVEIGRQWKGYIPAGTNTIVCNHDYNNTLDFGSSRWVSQWNGTPELIKVRLDENE